MVLAAGRGERMRPLTDDRPKPLLEVGGKALIVRVIESLIAEGFVDIVVNTAWRGEMLERALGDGAGLGASIRYSREPEGALGTAGGIARALPLLGDMPFLVVNGDVLTDYRYARLRGHPAKAAHVVLVDNPAHVPCGDFGLSGAQVLDGAEQTYTFSGIGAYRAALFDGLEGRTAELGPLLRAAIARGEVTGEHHAGEWTDVGTPERLAVADAAADTGRR